MKHKKIVAELELLLSGKLPDDDVWKGDPLEVLAITDRLSEIHPKSKKGKILQRLVMKRFWEHFGWQEGEY